MCRVVSARPQPTAIRHIARRCTGKPARHFPQKRPVFGKFFLIIRPPTGDTCKPSAGVSPVYPMEEQLFPKEAKSLPPLMEQAPKRNPLIVITPARKRQRGPGRRCSYEHRAPQRLIFPQEMIRLPRCIVEHRQGLRIKYSYPVSPAVYEMYRRMSAKAIRMRLHIVLHDGELIRSPDIILVTVGEIFPFCLFREALKG